MGTARHRDLPELESYLESLADPQILIDSSYRIVFANRAYRNTCAGGIEVAGRQCHEVSHGFERPCDECGEACPLSSARATGSAARMIHLHRTPRGDEHVQVEITPLLGPGGSHDLFVERLRDLSSTHDSARSDGLIGQAPSFTRMLGLVSRVAPTDTSVLLLGETGTGKEMVARAIHDSSARARAPFVAVDCSGLAETLFESELFGHERGAFTGALVRKAGLVEAAAGGTLFLDEVGDIPLGLQVKLLRLLETGAFRRVGGVEPLHASFRLIAATHRDLLGLVKQERFRSDLYFRIAAFPIALPPLRDRVEDIAPLARALLERVAPRRALRLSPDAVAALERHDFPGNVRELRNLMERASLLADDDVIDVSHLPADLHSAATADATPLEAAERRTMLEALHEHPFHRRELAAALGISERTLYRKLRRYGLARAQPPSM